jgi:predicted secreted protein with PEFG-CTERM motif
VYVPSYPVSHLFIFVPESLFIDAHLTYKLAKIIFVLVLVFGLGMNHSFAQDMTNQTDAVPIEKKIIERISSDGTIKVQIESNLPKEGNGLAIKVKFLDGLDEPVNHVNYDVIAMQDGEIVLTELGMYARNGINEHMTFPLSTDSQVVVLVVFQGIGENAPYAGPIGETLEVTVVPEFGSMVAMILTLAIIATMVLHRVRKVG